MGGESKKTEFIYLFNLFIFMFLFLIKFIEVTG